MIMENIYASNRLESLCRLLAENISSANGDAFKKEVIITQSAGMNSWLKTELSRRNGVFANFSFLNQDGLIAGIYQLLFKGRIRTNIDAIKYHIFKLLGCDAFNIAFPEVAAYYRESDLRRIQLSEKIADLFDQYQLYRPEMIEGWRYDRLSTDQADELWQQWLWKELNLESRAEIRDRLIAEMEVRKALVREAYPSISFFGLTIFTNFHLDFFRILEKYTTVNYYLCLPAKSAGFRNELLLSYGSKASELMAIFNIENFTPELNTGDSLLARIQNQIVENASGIEVKEDNSLTVNSCYTPVREVECLYNYLLDLFEKDKDYKSLKPGDILVMATDINKYAPFVKAVFNNAPVKIPFQVSGAANNSEDTITAAIEQIMNFREEDMTSENVISLLEQKRIRQRFGIEDCNYVRSVVRNANIRFGLENRVDDDSYYISWRYGLEKILLGYAMLTDEEYDGKFPFKDAEASRSYDLLRLKAFTEKLKSLFDVQRQGTLKTLDEWKLFLLEEIIEKMIYRDDFDKGDRAELSAIYRALSFTENLLQGEAVPFAVFLDELNSRLFTETRELKLNTGRVTISSPIPVRGIPFKVICFLGLNNDTYPRKDQFRGFDLLGEEYRSGDRSIKETDKFLFLDTILAAREKFYLSYVGQSTDDNTEIPPSTVIDTLRDYLGMDQMVVKHPLHGFSSRYQKDDQHLFTYLYGENADDFQPKEQEQQVISEVSVYSFVKFFEHPITWFFNTTLGISYEENDDTLPETELFDLDSLQAWQIKMDLLRLDDKEVELYLQKGIKEGLLPLKNLGKATAEELIEETAGIKSAFHFLTHGKEWRSVAIDLDSENFRISGIIDHVYQDQFITCSLSKSPVKDFVRAYLKTLLLYAQDEVKISSSVLIDREGNIKNLEIISAGDAKARLKELMVYLMKGIRSPLRFTLKVAEMSLKENADVNMITAAFEDESSGSTYSKMPPNKYMQILLREGFFENLNQDDMEEIRKLAGLLNLNKTQS
jgi:exodeoxyribonuclease V gamma subunit